MIRRGRTGDGGSRSAGSKTLSYFLALLYWDWDPQWGGGHQGLLVSAILLSQKNRIVDTSYRKGSAQQDNLIKLKLFQYIRLGKRRCPMFGMDQFKLTAPHLHLPTVRHAPWEPEPASWLHILTPLCLAWKLSNSLLKVSHTLSPMLRINWAGKTCSPTIGSNITSKIRSMIRRGRTGAGGSCSSGRRAFVWNPNFSNACLRSYFFLMFNIVRQGSEITFFKVYLRFEHRSRAVSVSQSLPLLFVFS